MIAFLYQIAIQLFTFVLKVAAPFSTKIRLGVNGRKNLISKLANELSALPGNKPVVWFHAASLGEFEQGRPVIEAYRQRFPDTFILLTFFSPSGYEVRKHYTGADYICYLPIDTRSNARRFLDIVKPQVAFFIKYEFWFNYLRELRQRQILTISFSAIFRPGHVVLKPYGGYIRIMLSRFDHIFVQNEESLQILESVGMTNCSVAGDTRFDRVKTISSQARELAAIAAFKNARTCLIAGSVWDADMQVLIPAINQMQGRFKAIIAPHEIHSEEIRTWMSQLNAKCLLHSQLADTPDPAAFECLIIDNIGMLSSLYRYGEMAYIGGSFGSGLHNILEAATFGLPVVFGNRSYHRFQEAIDLLEKGGAVSVSGETDIVKILTEWIENESKRKRLGEICRNYVLDNTGATDKILDTVALFLQRV